MADYEGDVCFCLPRWSGLIVVILLLFAGESLLGHTILCMEWCIYDAQGVRQCWRRWCRRRAGDSTAAAADAANAGNGREEQQELGDWHELDWVGPDSLNAVDLCAVSCALFHCFVFIEPLRNKVSWHVFLKIYRKTTWKVRPSSANWKIMPAAWPLVEMKLFKVEVGFAFMVPAIVTQFIWWSICFFWHVGLVQVANFSSAVHLPENMVPLMVHCSLFNVSLFTVQCPQVLGWNLTCQFEVLCWTCKFVWVEFLQCFWFNKFCSTCFFPLWFRCCMTMSSKFEVGFAFTVPASVMQCIRWSVCFFDMLEWCRWQTFLRQFIFLKRWYLSWCIVPCSMFPCSLFNVHRSWGDISLVNLKSFAELALMNLFFWDLCVQSSCNVLVGQSLLKRNTITNYICLAAKWS